MPKIRIFELARQIGVNSKDVIEQLNQYGKTVNNHFSSLDDADAKRLVSAFSSKNKNMGTSVREPDARPKDQLKEGKVVNKTETENLTSHKNATESDSPHKDAQRPRQPRAEGDGQHPPRPRPEGEGDGQRPRRPRPEGDGDGQRPPRPRPEGSVDGQRPRRPRPEGSADGQRPPRPRPEGSADGQRPPRPRPEGSVDGQRPRRPRPEGSSDGQRPPRPRPEGSADGQRPPRPRPEGSADGQRPRRPRPEGTADGQRPPRPRPEGSADGQRPPRPRPEGSVDGQRPQRPRQEGSADGQRPPRPRPEGSADGQRPPRPRPEGSVDGQRPPRPRPEGSVDGQRPPRPRPEGSVDGQRPPRPRTEGSTDGQRPPRPRTDGQRPVGQRPPRPRTDGQRTDGRPPARTDGAPRRNGPRTDAGGRPGAPSGGFRPGAPRKDDNRGGFAKPAGARPAFGKKDDKRAPEPSKDDRKQDWKKNEQMRTVKSKDNKDSERKENKQFLDRKDGRTRRGQGKQKSASAKRVMPKKIEPVITAITVSNEITVREMAEKLHKSNADIIKILMKKGIMATANQEIDYETAVYIGQQLNVTVGEYVEVDVFEEAFAPKDEDDGNKIERPPVVVVMGHVDHGKTSLLDVIRDASVQQTEAGGITQHIGAYTVMINNKPITFLDTPGHEAFTAMRMRGAQVTDIAVLVVAADDGVMPQTVEAINHAKAAGVDIIVAINKIDKPSANPDRVKQELTEHGLLVEDWGGETIAVPVSALKRTGIEQLLEMIIIVAEMKELRANPNKPARGSIIEAKLDKGRGPVATVLVQDGTLRVGDPVVVGPCFGKVRAMTDDKGRQLKEAGPSIPVEIIGLSDVPSAGDMFYVATDEKQARQLSETVIAKGRVSMIKASPGKVSLDDLFNQIQAGSVKDLNIVVKADVQGSIEALKSSLDKLSNEHVRVRTIHGGVGAITETDVMLASASNAIIIGFNVRPEPMAKTVADTEKVDIRLYRVIYSAIDDITAAMKGMLDPEYQERVLGHAEIRQLFRASGIGTIGGSYVLDGKILRSAQVRIVRDGKVVYEGTLSTLRRFKDDVKEVTAGYECGLLFTKFNDIKENDKVEAYVMEEIPR